jgi:hypothetical protein
LINPDWRLAIRYRTFDKRRRVNQAAIVENKRLGPILAYMAEQQKNSTCRFSEGRRGQKTLIECVAQSGSQDRHQWSITWMFCLAPTADIRQEGRSYFSGGVSTNLVAYRR